MASNEEEWTVVAKPKPRPRIEKRSGNYPTNEFEQRKSYNAITKPPRYNTRSLSRNADRKEQSNPRNFPSPRNQEYPEGRSDKMPFQGYSMKENLSEKDPNPKRYIERTKVNSLVFQKDEKDKSLTKRPGVIILPKGKTTKRSKKKNKTDQQYLKSVNQASLNLRDVLKETPFSNDKEGKKTRISTGVTIRPQARTSNRERLVPRNVLDSSAPLTHRGKERVTPKNKKPTKLKRLVLEERRIHRLQRSLRKTAEYDGNDLDLEEVALSSNGVLVPVIKVTFVNSDLSEREVEPEFNYSNENKLREFDGGAKVEIVLSKAEETENLNIVEEARQIEVISKPEVVRTELETFQVSFIGEGLPGLHTKKFREYCYQMPDKTIDDSTTKLLYELMRLQARQHDMNKIKAKGRKRLVFGFHEVTKHLKVQNLKCIVIARDLERSRAIGGLEHKIVTICSQCKSQSVQVIFALTKSTLSYSVCKPKTIVSIVGILNYDGRQGIYKDLVKLVVVKEQEYYETVSVKRKEVLNMGKENEVSLFEKIETENDIKSEGNESEISSSTILQDDISTTSNGSRKKNKNKKQVRSENSQSYAQIKKFELKDVESSEFIPKDFVPPETVYGDYPEYVQSGEEYFDYYQPMYPPGSYLYCPYTFNQYQNQYNY